VVLADTTNISTTFVTHAKSGKIRLIAGVIIYPAFFRLIRSSVPEVFLLRPVMLVYSTAKAYHVSFLLPFIA
jgi:hypothetical protein